MFIKFLYITVECAKELLTIEVEIRFINAKDSYFILSEVMDELRGIKLPICRNDSINIVMKELDS